MIKNALLPSRLFECTRQVTLSPFRPGQVEPLLPQTRAIFSRCGAKTRAERGDLRSRPPCHKTKFTTDAAGSLSGQEDAVSRRGRLLPGGSHLNLELGSTRSPFLLGLESFVVHWSEKGQSHECKSGNERKECDDHQKTDHAKGDDAHGRRGWYNLVKSCMRQCAHC